MSSEPSTGNLIVVSAPSGGGKTTICPQVIETLGGARYSVSHTTRGPRGSETDGVDYHFVSRAEFDALVAADNMIEWAEIHGNAYGTSRGELERARSAGQDLFLDIEGEGALQVRRRFPEAVLVYVIPPTVEVLRRRLTGRGTEDPREIDRRVANALREIDYARHYDYVIVNNDLRDAVADLAAIVRAARLRRKNQQDAILRFHTAP